VLGLVGDLGELRIDFRTHDLELRGHQRGPCFAQRAEQDVEDEVDDALFGGRKKSPWRQLNRPLAHTAEEAVK
jgi:hypothetical protein